jgi:hypothetical protein
VTASGSLGAILNDIESVFKCLASRPVHPETMCTNMDSPNLFSLLQNTTTLREILSHEVFVGAGFISLCEEVKAAEDKCLELSLSVTHSTENERMLVAGMQFMLAKQERLDRMLVQRLWERGHSASNLGVPTSNLGDHDDPDVMDVSRDIPSLELFITKRYWK